MDASRASAASALRSRLATLSDQMASAPQSTQRQLYKITYIISAVVFSLYCIGNYSIGLFSNSILHGSLAVLFSLVYFPLHKRHTNLAAHLHLCLLLVNFTITPMLEGGMRSQSLWFLPAVPMVAVFLFGRRATLPYVLACLGCIGINALTWTQADSLPYPLDSPIAWVLIRVVALGTFSTFGIVASMLSQQRLTKLEARTRELQQAIDTEKEAKRTQSQFLSTMSHEIRTPLNGILGMTQVLQLDKLAPPVAKSVETMHTCAEKLLKILNRILDLSKIEASGLEPTRSAFRPASLLEDALGELPAALQNNPNVIGIDTGTCSKERQGHPESLRRILGVLIENACQQEASAPVRLGFEEGNPPQNDALNPGASGQAVKAKQAHRDRFFVQDFGQGMSPQHQSRLADHLAASAQEVDHDPHGVGLGLTFAARLCHAVGARLSFESTPGQGTTFWLELDSNSNSQTGSTEQGAADPDLGQRRSRRTQSELRSTRLRSFLKIAAPVMGYYTIHTWLNGFYTGLTVNIITSVLFALAAFSNHRSPDSKLPSWLTLLALHFVFGASSLADGQIRSESMWLLPLVPTIASFLLGIEASFLCVLSCLGLIAFNTSIWYWMPLEQEYSERIIDFFVFRVVVLLAYTGIGAAAIRGSNQQLFRLNREESTLKVAKKKAQVATREKSRFLERMSHEIRTPMNGLLVSAEFLLTQSLPPAQQESVETIHRCGRHIVTLLNEVLELDEERTTPKEVARVPFDLTELLHDVAKLFQPRAQLAHLSLKVQSERDELLCIGDPTRILQIVSNLVGNAIKFSDGGVIVIELEVPDAEQQASNASRNVRVSVRDQGIGISESQLPLVFQDFVQVDARNNDNARGGTGLGLSISRRLAKSMGGDIRVESELGEGSNFILELELELQRNRVCVAAVEPSQADSNAPYQGLQVLVVDDNAINRRVAQFQLERLGCAIETGEDGQQAVEMASKKRYDVIFMDLRMPNLNGIEATKAIRAGQGLSQGSYIVALTADSYEQQKQACLDSGMNQHLAKPYSAAQLQAVLSRAELHNDSQAA